MSAPAVGRLCRVRAGDPTDEAPFALDPDGFLASRYDSSRTPDGASDDALISAEAAAQSGALVLLGEPGVGKSTVLRALTENLPAIDDAADGEPCVLWLDGAELTDNSVGDLLCDHLERLPQNSSPASQRLEEGSSTPPPQLTIVLDQLDESAIHRRLDRLVSRAVRGRDTSGLRWLVACRAVDYYAPLTKQLEADGRSAVVADLAPLSREQAISLADEFGVDGEGLVAAAVGAGVGALASIPLTLRLLAELSRGSGTLTGAAVDLFHRSVRQLLGEPGEGRRRSIDAELDQLFAVAARVAARVVLSGGRTIWIGREIGHEASRNEIDILPGLLPGGHETTTSGPFGVTAALVEATLATAVFSPRGADRLAFSHSSIGAYLAACNLSSRKVSEHQLKSLFLVAADDGSTSIPSPLRETAAWLITLQPSHASWLAEADPRSLASYSSFVDNPMTRRVLVSAMLRRAGDLELGDLPWQLDRTRLAYPGLADQLALALAEVTQPPEPWSDRARARLAVRLAHQAEPSAELIEALLQIAESPQWDTHERRLAVGALEDIDLDVAGPRLRRILDTELNDPLSRATADPDDELRGGLLLALWPKYLTLTEALKYVGPRSKSHMGSAYAVFAHELPIRVADDELPDLLQWAARSANGTAGPATAAWDGADSSPRGTPLPVSGPRTDNRWGIAEGMIEPLLDRMTSWRFRDRFMDQVATLVWPVLHADDHFPIPLPLDAVALDGSELPMARHARRALCLALCRTAKTSDPNPLTAIRIVQGWTSRFGITAKYHDESGEYRLAKRHWLVDRTDFAWVLSEAAAALATGDQDLGLVLARIASAVMDPDDREAHESAFMYEETPLWEMLRGHFDPIPLDSALAEALRRRAQSRPQPVFAEAQAFQDKIIADCDRVASGDTDAFWQLLWKLQFDPQTGRGQLPSMVDDPRKLPAASLAEPVLSEILPQAALRFVTSTDDHRAEWLGTTHFDWRAWAGYLALALLEQLGLTAELADDVWRSWIGALLWFPTGSGTDNGESRRRRLLAAASQSAYHDLNNAIPIYTIGEIARGSAPNDLDLDDEEFVLRHRGALHQIVDTLGTALRSGTLVTTAAVEDHRTDHERPGTLPLSPDAGSQWRHVAARAIDPIMRALMTVGDRPTIDAAMAAIQLPPEDGLGNYQLICADALLHTGAIQFSALLDIFRTDGRFAVQLANHVGMRSHSINQHLDEHELADLLRWLETLPRTEVDSSRQSWVVRDADGVGEWRSQTLRDLANRQNAAALEQLNALQQQFPDRLDIRAAALTVRTAVHASLWTPPDANAVALLLADAERRLIRTNKELADLIVETLDRIEQDLPPHGELLWDRQRRPGPAGSATKQAPRKNNNDIWTPKPEAALCAYLAHELQIRLHRQGIAINREVLVQPTDPYGAGHRTDILIEAHSGREPWSSTTDIVPSRLAVVIEAKGNWNRGLENDLIGQLAGRYLPDVQTDTGVYLVGWFPVDQWTEASDRRRDAARKRDRAETHALLTEQAASLNGKRVIVRTMHIPRPQPQE